MTNLYLISIHESPLCVVDMLRNLRAMDQESGILIYNRERLGYGE
jgi:hypothetical protein